MLPKEELYTPPMNIRVRDNRQFGRKPLVGVNIIKTLEAYRCEPTQTQDEDTVIDVPGRFKSSYTTGGPKQLPVLKSF